MSVSLLTFHESYGYLPKSTLWLVNRYNVSPMDFDDILDAFGWMPYPPEDVPIQWDKIEAFILNASGSGIYRPSRYL